MSSGDKKVFPQGVGVDDPSTISQSTNATQRGVTLSRRGLQYFIPTSTAGNNTAIINPDQTPGLNLDQWFLGTIAVSYGYKLVGDTFEAMELRNIGTRNLNGGEEALITWSTIAGYNDFNAEQQQIWAFTTNIEDNATCVALATRGVLYAMNGTFAVAIDSASADNQAATTKQPLMVAGPGNWTLTNAPAANTQATATRAAGAAGVRHVLTSIQATLNAVAAVVAPLTVVVRDGASGAGTILWQDRVTSPAGTDGRISISGLNIVGSAATAMTVEFTAAPGATNFETISATGYSVDAGI